MELLNNLNTLVIDAILTLYHSVQVPSIDTLMPAQIDRVIDQSHVASSVRSLLQLVGIVLTIVFGVLLALAIAKKRALKNPAGTLAGAERREDLITATPAPGALRERWNEILGHLESPRENDWKQAVVEADKLVDSALQQAGFPGDSFGDRLTNIQPGTLLSLDGIWWAHRIRNRIAHELDYFLRYTEARQAVSYFQAALEELQLV
jgi:hypothetical protein